MKVRIVSDGTGPGTRILDAETGDMLPLVKRVVWEFSAGSSATLRMAPPSRGPGFSLGCMPDPDALVDAEVVEADLIAALVTDEQIVSKVVEAAREVKTRIETCYCRDWEPLACCYCLLRDALSELDQVVL